MGNRCITQSNLFKKLHSTPNLLGDPPKHLDGTTEFFKEHNFSYPVFCYSSFFLAKNSRSKIFFSDFFKQLNFCSQFFCLAGDSPRKKLSCWNLPAKKSEQVKSMSSKKIDWCKL